MLSYTARLCDLQHMRIHMKMLRFVEPVYTEMSGFVGRLHGGKKGGQFKWIN